MAPTAEQAQTYLLGFGIRVRIDDDGNLVVKVKDGVWLAQMTAENTQSVHWVGGKSVLTQIHADGHLVCSRQENPPQASTRRPKEITK